MRVTVFDLEATSLNGNWGRILAAGFKDLGDDKITTYRRDVAPWRGRNKISDERMAQAIRKRLAAADILVGWNSIRYDIPLINTRLVANGDRILNVSEKNGLQHIDLMYYARGTGLNIGSSKLSNVAAFFGLGEKTPLEGEIWQLAAAGDTDAMDQVEEHCAVDVDLTAQLFPLLAPFIKKLKFDTSEVYPWLTEIPSRKN